MTNDYYKILGVDYSASEREIRSAYRSLVKKNHPDTNADNSKSNSFIIDIYDAYKILSNNETRKVYDAFLAQRLASQKKPANSKITPDRRYKPLLIIIVILIVFLLTALVWKKTSQNQTINNTNTNQKEILKENTPKSSQEIKF